MTTKTDVRLRALKRADWVALAAIDEAHTGLAKPEWWQETVERHRKRSPGSFRVGLVATDGEAVVGYLLGQLRAFEFGSEPCGWIYAVGVQATHLRTGVAGRLLAEARARFRSQGARMLRTMVRKDDVPTLTFFRSAGFAAGPFVELEQSIATEDES